jgi:exosome complex exonuclease DIS3/RRP44
VNRFNPYEGWVASESVGQDILIPDRLSMNRAIDGDAVAVELLPPEQWRGPSKTLPRAARGGDAVAGEDEEADDEEGRVPEVRRTDRWA